MTLGLIITPVLYSQQKVFKTTTTPGLVTHGSMAYTDVGEGEEKPEPL